MEHPKFKVSQYVVILNKENKALLLKTSEKTKIPNKWSFPGGHLKSNETIEDSLKREVQEETNLKIKILSPITTNLIKDTYTLIFVGEYLSGEINLSEEHKDNKWSNIEEMKELDLIDPILIEYAIKAIKIKDILK